MKNNLILLFTIISTFVFSRTEIVLPGGTGADISNAITTLGGNGTITIKGDFAFTSGFDIPEGITLNFFTGNKFELNGVSMNIYGKIIATTNQIFDVSDFHNLKIYNQVVYPEWFGAFNYQDTTVTSENERKQIQRAVDALPVNGELLFTGKKYIVDNAININTGGIKIKGNGVYLSGSSLTNYITTDNTSTAGVIFNVKRFGLRISDFNFKSNHYESKGINAKGTAVNFVMNDGDNNIDASISGCSFLGFRYGIYAEGANLKVVDNTFTACYIGININQAASTNMTVKANTRGHIIDRNRFHSIGSYLTDPSLDGSTAIRILGTEPVSALQELQSNSNTSSQLVKNFQNYSISGYYNHISNNYADDCKTFFYGTVDRTKIDGNSILLSGGTAISTFGGEHGAITNNMIDGSFRWNANQLYYSGASSEVPSGHGIQVEYSHHLTIHNNQILNKRFHGIYIIKSKNSSIQANTIKNFNNRRYLASGLGYNPNSNLPNNGEPDLIEFDAAEYDGIHIKKIQNANPNVNKYNIQNVVANNVIGISVQNVAGRYGIYVGDGDDWNFVKNNFIANIRLTQALKIE